MTGLSRRRGGGSSNSNGPCLFRWRHGIICIVLVTLSICLCLQFRFLKSSLRDDNTNEMEQQPSENNKQASTTNVETTTKSETETEEIPWTCTFREYPPRRYYYLNEKLDFLNAEYIYGLPPQVLESTTSDLERNQGKICVNQQESTKDSPTTRPFADGTNPSIVALKRLPTNHVLLQKEIVPEKDPSLFFLVSVSITNGQCSWQDTQEEKLKYQLSPLNEANSVYTSILIVNSKLRTQTETNLMLDLDAPWGRQHRQAQFDETKKKHKRVVKAFDDSRLFVHNAQVWVSFREGKGFGYDKQVISPVHFEFSANDNKMQAHVKASETTTFCCGRNMALVSDGKPDTQLQSMTWVDPVTMVNVNDGTTKQQRRLVHKKDSHRQLGQERQSHFHGTNGFMLHFPTTSEYFGIGHFHRPPHRDSTSFARHGHHYTHAFFTTSTSPPYRLTRLSREFVFPTKSNTVTAGNVTDMIQFASGAELIGSDANGKLLILYGINDCEGASIYLDMKMVQEMLLPVEEGKQVVDLMKKL